MDEILVLFLEPRVQVGLSIPTKAEMEPMGDESTLRQTEQPDLANILQHTRLKICSSRQLTRPSRRLQVLFNLSQTRKALDEYLEWVMRL